MRRGQETGSALAAPTLAQCGGTEWSHRDRTAAQGFVRTAPVPAAAVLRPRRAAWVLGKGAEYTLSANRQHCRRCFCCVRAAASAAAESAAQASRPHVRPLPPCALPNCLPRTRIRPPRLRLLPRLLLPRLQLSCSGAVRRCGDAAGAAHRSCGSRLWLLRLAARRVRVSEGRPLCGPGAARPPRCTRRALARLLRLFPTPLPPRSALPSPRLGPLRQQQAGHARGCPRAALSSLQRDPARTLSRSRFDFAGCARRRPFLSHPHPLRTPSPPGAPRTAPSYPSGAQPSAPWPTTMRRSARAAGS